MFSFLGLDPLKRAEAKLREGQHEEAMHLFAKAGDFRQAAKLAAQLRDELAAVKYSLRAVLGSGAEAYGDMSTLQAGELLATAGHHREALALFELGQGFCHAARSSLKLGQEGRAARYFELGKDFASAALYYERSGNSDGALRALEQDAERLRRERMTGPDVEKKKREIDERRAELLRRLGRPTEAATLLLNLGPSLLAARTFEEIGNLPEAIRMYLAVGDPEKALELVSKSQGLDLDLVAEVYKRCGRAIEAARVLAARGKNAEAAELYEHLGEWIRAGTAWEAARQPLKAAKAYEKGGRTTVAARCLADAGRMSTAAELYEQAGDLGAAATCRLKAGEKLAAGKLFLAAERPADATQALLTVDAKNPGFEEAVVLLARAHVEQGKPAEALEHLRKIPPEHRQARAIAGDCLYWGGRAFEALGRRQEAAMCYQRLLTTPGDARDAALRLAGLGPVSDATISLNPDTPTTVLPAAPQGDELPAGHLLADRYRIVKTLGRGGMGRVYKAEDLELGEPVAVKTLLHLSEQDGEDEARLLREVQICRKLTHPNIVRVFDMGRFPGGIFVTMELLEGQPLDLALRQKGPLGFGQARAVLAEILAGLEEAHRAGVVHRDLKPSNVFLTGGRLRILDFGIARMAGQETRLTQTGMAVGSPHYMSPEQLRGHDLDGRSDLYSLGILAFVLLTGREPFADRPLSAIFLAHLNEEVADLRTVRPDTPDAWAAYVQRLLAKRAEERFHSASAAAAALALLPTV